MLLLIITFVLFLPYSFAENFHLCFEEDSQMIEIEKEIHQRINYYRENVLGLAPLELSESISSVSRQHSRNMAKGWEDFGHGGFKERINKIGRTIQYHSASENVYQCMRYNASKVATVAVKGWIKSTGHRKNIEGDYNLTGIGVAKNSKGEYYCTQIFIKTGNIQKVQRSDVADSANDFSDIEQEIHRRINQHRKKKHNLSTLQFSQTIRQACRKHSEQMAKGKVNFGHDGFNERIDKIGEVISYLSASENVSTSMGYDRSKVAEVAVKGWIKSSGHHKNMIGDYTLTGVGVYQNQDGHYYCTQIFVKEY